MVQKLYGIVHASQIRMGGIPLDELFGCPDAGSITIIPSRELLREIRQLPKGARVGLEQPAELVNEHNILTDSIKVDGKEYKMATKSVVYWQSIVNQCVANGLQPVFLDDTEFIRASTRKREQARKLDRKSGQLYRKSKAIYGDKIPEHTRAKGIGLIREAYRLEQEAWYINTIARESPILRKIAETKPYVVVMGAGHTDFFMANPEEIAKFGFKFESYAREAFEEGLSAMALLAYSDGPLSMSPPRLIQNAEPDRVSIASRNQIIRRYNAAVLGRIIPDGKPDFIGTWDLDIPARGLFEMYLAKDETKANGIREISGTIEDVIGTAAFTGTIASNTFNFKKDYDSIARQSGGIDGTLNYSAQLEKGKYSGTIAGSGSPFLRFEMEACKK